MMNDVTSQSMSHLVEKDTQKARCLNEQIEIESNSLRHTAVPINSAQWKAGHAIHQGKCLTPKSAHLDEAGRSDWPSPYIEPVQCSSRVLQHFEPS